MVALGEENTRPWQRETTRKDLPDHGFLGQGTGEGIFLTLQVMQLRQDLG